MQRFSALLKKVGFAATAMTLPPDLVLTPASWSASDRGGMKQCTINASGSAESLAYLCGWLGDRIEIFNEAGDPCWWGTLWDIEVSLGNVVVNLSLDQVYNRVAVIYPLVNADGSESSDVTAWAQNQNSIDRYGKRELLYGMPSAFTKSADFVRDHLLLRFKEPGPIISTQATAQFSARLTGQGTWYKAASVYFTNLDGLVEHMGESGSQVIGRHIISTLISFGTATPGGLGTGSEADEIVISSGNFDPLTIGDTFTLSGAANGANNDTFNVDHQDASNQIGISGTFTPEAAGANVKISWGDGISVDNIAQSFELDTGWTVTHVAVKVRRVGSPSDNFRIGIYPDAAGVPGTVLEFVEVLGSTLFTELTWTEFAFATPVALSASTTYYVAMRRTGAANLTDGYEVAMDEDLGYLDGSFRHYNGSAWVARVPDADMPFRVIGEISSTAQLGKALAVVDGFLYNLVQVDSEIPVRQFSDSERFASDVVEEMLDAGTSTGERLIAWVTYDSAVVVDIVPLSSEENLILGSDGKIRFPTGSPYIPGRLVFGQFVDVDGLLLLDGLGISRTSSGAATYVAESSYDAASDMLTISGEGALDPFQTLSIRKG